MITVLSWSCQEDCPDGFSGKDCEIRASDAFLGTYEGTVDCGAGRQYVKLDIKRKTGPFDVTIDLTEAPGFQFDGTVLDAYTFLIPDQVLEIEDNDETSYYFVFESQGELSGDTLDFPIILLPAGILQPEKVTCHYEVIK